MGSLCEADLEQLHARLEKPIYNVVYRWVWEPDEAQDIVQEAFVRLWRMRERVESSTAQPLVYRIALNLAASRRRWKKLRRWVPLDALTGESASGVDAGEALSRSQTRARVRAAVLALPDDLRSVVLLCEFSDMSYEEIARVLRIPPGTVASRRHRALKLLRKRLSACDDVDEQRVRQPV